MLSLETNMWFPGSIMCFATFFENPQAQHSCLWSIPGGLPQKYGMSWHVLICLVCLNIEDHSIPHIHIHPLVSSHCPQWNRHQWCAGIQVWASLQRSMPVGGGTVGHVAWLRRSKPVTTWDAPLKNRWLRISNVWIIIQMMMIFIFMRFYSVFS